MEFWSIMKTFKLRFYSVPNRKHAAIFKEYEFLNGNLAHMRSDEIRSDLHAAGFKTLPGFACMQAAVSFALADGGFAALQVA
jgi:hypothetical protein